jgi:hypothetical protein
VKHEEGRGVGVKNPKPSCHGLVSGTPHGMEMGDVAWGWHSGTYQVVVVVQLCGRETQGGERVWVKIRNRAAVAWFQATMGLQEVEGGAVWLQPPPSMLT